MNTFRGIILGAIGTALIYNKDSVVKAAGRIYKIAHEAVLKINLKK